MEKTIKDLIIALRCRRGTADGTTKQGAYWLAMPPILIRKYGGDGKGGPGMAHAPTMKHHLELRHYRGGETRAMVRQDGWFEGQGDGVIRQYFPADLVMDCQSVEEVIVTLKGMECKNTAAYSDQYPKNLVEALQPIGLPLSLPAPDDCEVAK